MLVRIKSAEKAYEAYCKIETSIGCTPMLEQEFITYNSKYFNNIYYAKVMKNVDNNYNIKLYTCNNTCVTPYGVFWALDELEIIPPKFKEITAIIESKLIDGITISVLGDLPPCTPGIYLVLPLKQYALLTVNRQDIVTKVGNRYINKASSLPNNKG